MDPNALMNIETTQLIGWGITAGKALATVIIGWIVAGWAQGVASRALQKANVDAALAKFMGQMVRYTIIFATLIAAAGALGFDTTSLMTIFASGVMILFFKPFSINDWITISSTTGQVMEVGLFATDLMKLDGTKVVVPNGAITGGTIENHTVLGKRRASIAIGVGYGVDLEDVRAALTRAADAVEEILDDPAYKVVFVDFGGSSLDWLVHCWSKPADYMTMQEKLRVNIYNELNAADIEIPFPQIVVHNAPEEG